MMRSTGREQRGCLERLGEVETLGRELGVMRHPPEWLELLIEQLLIGRVKKELLVRSGPRTGLLDERSPSRI